MESIYKEADIVSLHIPLTEETTYLVNNNFINSFAQNFYLINNVEDIVVFLGLNLLYADISFMFSSS